MKVPLRCALLLALAPPAWAQPQPSEPAPHPGIVLGARSRQVQDAQRAMGTVVVVPDTGSFADAVAAWGGHDRFPVLIDDGSDRAAEAIGRFVRGYGAERVVVWSGGEAWPQEREARETRLTSAWVDAMAAAAHVDTTAEALALMKASGYTPAGVVAIDPADPAWVGGLALAAGRLCPMVFITTPPGGIDGHLTHERADELAAEIESGVQALGLRWRDLGDDVDAVTLASNAPGRIRVDRGGKRSHFALTDRIGRHNAGGLGTRWGWCGQVHGDAVDAAYRAMSSLFLGAGSAWVFDGYPTGGAWDAFDGTEAGSVLSSAGLEVRVHDVPGNSAADWAGVAARGVDAGLLLVNSKGRADAFELNPGALHPGDVPPLLAPALLHMVHSFAFERPDNPRTVGGRFMSRGVWGAVGSVDEPYLQAFVPTPMVARRLTSGMAWGAAGRIDAGPLWKITVLGDPLHTLGLAPAPGDAEPALEGARPVNEMRAEAVRERRFGEALRWLVIAGRDEDAARLAAALLEQSPEDLTPEGAALAIGPLLRTGRPAAVAGAFGRLDPVRQREPALADALWHAARATMGGPREQAMIDLLDAHLREGQQAFDAIELGRRLERLAGAEAATGYLRRARDRMPSDRARGEIDKALDRMARTRP